MPLPTGHLHLLLPRHLLAVSLLALGVEERLERVVSLLELRQLTVHLTTKLGETYHLIGGVLRRCRGFGGLFGLGRFGLGLFGLHLECVRARGLRFGIGTQRGDGRLLYLEQSIEGRV